MKDKYFMYDVDAGFETFSTEEDAKAAAEESIDTYRKAAVDEGWNEDVDSVCWGKVSESAEQFGMGEKIRFDGELVEAVDYKLTSNGSSSKMIEALEEEVKKLRFMVDHGLGYEDLERDLINR